MSSFKQIRRRIQAVQSTQKLTRAMKLIAAARLKKTEDAALCARPYTAGLHTVVANVSKRLGNRAPVMWRRPIKLDVIDVLVVSTDRGFCGGFNETLLSEIVEGYEEHITHNIDIKFYVLGRQGINYLRSRGHDVIEVPTEGGDEGVVNWVLSQMIGRYCDGESAGGHVCFNRFGSATHYEPTFWNLLPLYERGDDKERHLEYLYEPDRNSTLDYLCVEMLTSSIKQALLESRAAELAARLTAMDGATRNADDMIAHLKAEYNKRRQEAITSELMDIVGGAEALGHMSKS
jgi:F-type H+-transporting ATPase subunit gamma